ncbi:DUF2946 domain-containing protein [Pectobacterium quasiaquaticum]|uniref:DUF2946 domain-containing protein n=1 Tax=Pectobacterium quasiaquaticum TaxID=2774015 RepID=A0A9Q2IDE1_9GAMM|nr:MULTISPECIES: DUF2946 domain-containing protein [Pectobacterium]MBE5202835.1 DUF2946 domain-containing protein [Pectobacterium quasiaquaticum]MBE5211872.1 DUF2946 domain-containing protein [Pectobacterium quasiaquaticum]MBE5212344.1 DUF2946 domain-containing protein [Pectobacterium quasiaquaticum]MBE5225850.1 DUF2946 domain-containing protein [Pectobacterium quasiaquaticum]MBN3064797.1 DUF2946 domain-containing protein [Pectobacterium aquaticum]
MLLSALRRRSFPAWVGIFAILTIFIAPVISQTLVFNGAHTHEYGTNPHNSATHNTTVYSTTVDATSAYDTAASIGHSGSISEPHHNHTGQEMFGHHATQSHHSPSSPSMMMDHAACGYCVLFSYTPALFATSSPNPILTTSLSKALVIHFISRTVLPERYASPVVRAPPF